jgi:PilZ domain
MWEWAKRQAERRAAPRESGPFAAVARLYSGQSQPCVVVNLSDTGAKLALSRNGVLPKEFELTIPARNASWRVRVVWQKNRELGVYRLR